MSIVTQPCLKNKDFSDADFSKKENLLEDVGILVMRDNRKYGFTAFSNAILTHPKLSRRAKLVYGILLFHARQQDHCWPSQETIAEEATMSVDTVQRGLKDLHDFDFSGMCAECSSEERCPLHKDGLICWKQRGLNLTNLYCITPLYSTYDELEQEGNKNVVVEDQETKQAPCVVASGKPQNTEIKGRKKPDESNLILNLSPLQKTTEDSNLYAESYYQEDSKKAWEAWKESKGKRDRLPDYATILITDLSNEWGDSAHLTSNLTQTANLFLYAKEQLRYNEDQFNAILYMMRQRASKGRVSLVRGKSTRMKYFFACLRNKLYGLRE